MALKTWFAFFTVGRDPSKDTCAAAPRAKVTKAANPSNIGRNIDEDMLSRLESAMFV
jgi:hypothetical protein